VVDDRAARRLTEDLVVSGGRLAIAETGECRCELEILVPRLAPPFPLALRVDLVRLGDSALRAWVGSLIVDESSSTTASGGDEVHDVGYSISLDPQGNHRYKLNFLVPEINAARFRGQISAQISVRSSREVALSKDNLEHFLSLSAVQRVFSITIDDARHR